MPAVLRYVAMGVPFALDCSDQNVREVLVRDLEAFADPAPRPAPPVTYTVVGDPDRGFVITRNDEAEMAGRDVAAVAYAVEKDLILELQRRRRELCFFHAAAVELDGHGYLLAAESGNGKSTTTWALLHRGFRYLTDELSAVDAATLEVHAFPYALSLKATPPAPFSLPAAVYRLGNLLHVPVHAMPRSAVVAPVPLAGVFLIDYQVGRPHPAARPLSTAEAASRLYVSLLNALAHPAAGIDAVLDLVSRVPVFALDAADLQATCRLIRGVVSASAAIPPVR